jgi:pyrroline-5-carboxylate reductase
LFANGLAVGAERLGIDRKTAVRLAAQTMLGAGKMLLQYEDPIDLKNKVCSPGGTTLAGIAALEEGSLEDVAASAVDAAYRRTLELKK